MPKLTKSFVDGIEPGPKDQFIWDAALPRFGLRVKPSGAKSYLIQYRNSDGTSKRHTIGQHGQITPDEARRSATKMLAQIVLREADPRGDRIAARKALTVEQLCRDYLEAAEAGVIITRRRRPKSASTLTVDRGRIARHILPLLGSKRARDLTSADVATLFAKVQSGATATVQKSDKLRGKVVVTGGTGTAKKAVTLLSAILSFAKRQRIVTENVVEGFVLPSDGKRSLEDPRAMLDALGAALQGAEDRGEAWQAIYAIRLAALTGMRAGEVTCIKWGEVDFARSALRLQKTKTGASVRPLNQPARSLLAPLYASAPDNRRPEDFVFPAARSEGKPFGGLPGAVRRICGADHLDEDVRHRLQGFSLHLLRHAFASIANEMGVTEITLAAILGHAKGGVTAGYVSKMDGHLLHEANRVAQEISDILEGHRAGSLATRDDENWFVGEIIDADGKAYGPLQMTFA